MQLFAFDEKRKLVFVKHAEKHRTYYCRECGLDVRPRGGHIRKDHFFHLGRNAQCSQDGKGLAHIHLQYYLQSLFPKAVLECQFPAIKRIADVCLRDASIIFEIQCSFMTQKELLARNADYGLLGFTVIWILHDQVFNQRRFTAAEMALLSRPYLHTNMDENGHGLIYDQIDIFNRGFREIVKTKLPVDLTSIKPIKTLPPFLLARKSIWPYHFQGDKLDFIDRIPAPKVPVKPTLKQEIKRFFINLYNFALEVYTQ